MHSNANTYDTRDAYINNQAGHMCSERPNNCALGIWKFTVYCYGSSNVVLEFSYLHIPIGSPLMHMHSSHLLYQVYSGADTQHFLGKRQDISCSGGKYVVSKSDTQDIV